jgi:hypothetical protein
MKTLAFVIYTITAPADLAGVELITKEPVECVINSDATIPVFQAQGIKVDARCIYTNAPIASARPVARPTGGKP